MFALPHVTLYSCFAVSWTCALPRKAAKPQPSGVLLDHFEGSSFLLAPAVWTHYDWKRQALRPERRHHPHPASLSYATAHRYRRLPKRVLCFECAACGVTACIFSEASVSRSCTSRLLSLLHTARVVTDNLNIRVFGLLEKRSEEFTDAIVTGRVEVQAIALPKKLPSACISRRQWQVRGDV